MVADQPSCPTRPGEGPPRGAEVLEGPGGSQRTVTIDTLRPKFNGVDPSGKTTRPKEPEVTRLHDLYDHAGRAVGRHLRRGYLNDGGLEKLVASGIRGVTSNRRYGESD